MKSAAKKNPVKNNPPDTVRVSNIKGTDRSRILALQISEGAGVDVYSLRPKPPLPSPCTSGECFLPIINKNMQLKNPRPVSASNFVPYIEMVEDEEVEVRFSKLTKTTTGSFRKRDYKMVRVSTMGMKIPNTIMKRINPEVEFTKGYYSMEITDDRANIIQLSFEIV